MSHRVITPYAGFPDREFLSALEGTYQNTRSTPSAVHRRRLHSKCLQLGTVAATAVSPAIFYIECIVAPELVEVCVMEDLSLRVTTFSGNIRELVKSQGSIGGKLIMED